MDHDQSYKLLFSHPEMVADLLRGFVREDWVEHLVSIAAVMEPFCLRRNDATGFSALWSH